MRTSHLLEALAMQPADRVVLLFQLLQAACQRVCDFPAVRRVVVWVHFAVIERGLHLPYCLDQAICLLGHFMLLVGDLLQLAMERLGQRGEELQYMLVSFGHVR